MTNRASLPLLKFFYFGERCVHLDLSIFIFIFNCTVVFFNFMLQLLVFFSTLNIFRLSILSYSFNDFSSCFYCHEQPLLHVQIPLMHFPNYIRENYESSLLAIMTLRTFCHLLRLFRMSQTCSEYQPYLS